MDMGTDTAAIRMGRGLRPAGIPVGTADTEDMADTADTADMEADTAAMAADIAPKVRKLSNKRI